jgi:hypothetical protein
MMTISQDFGETWHEISNETFAEMLGDLQTDCWVDLSQAGGARCHVTLSWIRDRRECEGPLPGQQSKMPTELYGIPIVYDDKAPKITAKDISLARMKNATHRNS